MNQFRQFNIKHDTKSFEGDKIRMIKILNREIIVYDYKVKDSTAYPEKGDGKCLHLQISLNGEKYILFTSGIALIDDIQKIPKDNFPFSTTIVQQNQMFIFT